MEAIFASASNADRVSSETGERWNAGIARMARNRKRVCRRTILKYESLSRIAQPITPWNVPKMWIPTGIERASD